MYHRIYYFSGGYGLEETPDPIPNSAVKLKDANGTAGATPWESRSPPGLRRPCKKLQGLRPLYIIKLGRLSNYASGNKAIKNKGF